MKFVKNVNVLKHEKKKKRGMKASAKHVENLNSFDVNPHKHIVGFC